MNALDLVRLALSRLRSSRLRAALTMLGVIIGVASVVSLVAVGQGATAGITKQLQSLGTNLLTVNPGRVTTGATRGAAGSSTSLTLEDASALAEIDGVAAVAPELSTQKIVVGGTTNTTTTIVGTTASHATVRNETIWQGSYLTDASVELGLRVAVLGSTTATDLGLGSDAVGADITIGGIPFRVIGLLVKQGSILGQSQDNVVYIPRETLCKAWGANRNVGIYVRAKGGVPGVPASMDEMRVIFRAIRKLKPGEPDPVAFVTSDAIMAVWRTISAGAFSLLVFISGISLLVGAIVIANIMLVSVVERTKEIGLRLAVGARKSDIRRQFLLEAILLAFGGGALGVFFGWTIALCVDAFSPLPARVTPGLIVSGLTLATITGLIAGVFPAVKASHLPPIEALRHE